nr:MAG TPA: hypothetical protein [Caudoviricetes sp.]
MMLVAPSFSISPHPTPTTLNPFNRLNSSGYPLYLLWLMLLFIVFTFLLLSHNYV